MAQGSITYEQEPYVLPNETLHFYTYTRGNWRLQWSVVARTDDWFYGEPSARKAFADAIHRIRRGAMQWNYRTGSPTTGREKWREQPVRDS